MSVNQANPRHVFGVAGVQGVPLASAPETLHTHTHTPHEMRKTRKANSISLSLLLLLLLLLLVPLSLRSCTVCTPHSLSPPDCVVCVPYASMAICHFEQRRSQPQFCGFIGCRWQRQAQLKHCTMNEGNM